jgi:hypothetical protein
MPQSHFESLTLEVDSGERVPAILQHPRADTVVPGVLLLHGFSQARLAGQPPRRMSIGSARDARRAGT